MSKQLDKMTPIQIITAVRARDLEIIRKLVIDEVKVKKIWSQNEVASLVEVDKGTVSKWINGSK